VGVQITQPSAVDKTHRQEEVEEELHRVRNLTLSWIFSLFVNLILAHEVAKQQERTTIENGAT